MAIIIDGYNLMHALGVVGPRGKRPALAPNRARLLSWLVASLAPEELTKVTVVFDAHHPAARPDELTERGMRIMFATGFDDADSLVEELIRRESVPKKLLVVSSDHRLQRAAKRRGALAVDSEAWIDELSSRPPKDRAASKGRSPTADDSTDRPPAGSPAEVEFWSERIRADGLADDETLRPPGESVFPPGYTDDLFPPAGPDQEPPA